MPLCCMHTATYIRVSHRSLTPSEKFCMAEHRYDKEQNSRVKFNIFRVSFGNFQEQTSERDLHDEREGESKMRFSVKG